MRSTLILLLMVALTFAGCQKEAQNELNEEAATNTEIELRDDVEAPHGGPDGALGRPACLHLVFPLTVNFPDGTTAEAENRKELHDLLHDWRDNNPDATSRPMIAFPHDIELPGGVIVTVQNADQLENFVRRCQGKAPKPDRRHCFQLVFPVSVNFPDGTTATANSPADLMELGQAWHENNPDATERPEIAFPHDVELPGGSVVTVNNREELKELIGDCRDDQEFNRPCFRLVFPLDIKLPDGTSITVDTPKALHDMLHDWRHENRGASERPAFVYPLEIQYQDGTTTTINDREAFEAAREACGG